jgi:DHA1 family bicyclomycin/chloramphenicol resistance-like MFS transporter
LGFESLWLFLILTTLIMTTFGFLGANFNTMAMEPLGDIAGTASSVIGFVSTLGGAILGYVMGQLFDGSTINPLNSHPRPCAEDPYFSIIYGCSEQVRT